jgi:hypothetical protein
VVDRDGWIAPASGFAPQSPKLFVAMELLQIYGINSSRHINC